MPVYKLWTADRRSKKLVVAGSCQELIEKGKTKINKFNDCYAAVHYIHR